MGLKAMFRTKHSDEGFALPTVLGAVALLTVIAVGGFYVAQNALTDATRVSKENRAYQAASSALEAELSVFNPTTYAGGQSGSGYAYGTKQHINGLDWYVVDVLDSSDLSTLGDAEYEMVALGGSGDTTESVRVRFMSFNLWDMNISGGENSAVGSGAGLNGNGRIIGKVYCNGDMDWSGNGSIEGGPVFVRNGTFNKQSAGSNVGLADAPIPVYFDNPPTGKTAGMYTVTKGSAPKLQVPWPTEDNMTQWKTMAIADSARNLLGDGTGVDGVVRNAASVSNTQYNVFDGDLTLGGTDFGRPGTAPLTGAIDELSSGDVLAVSGNTLFVNGTVYIDGALTIGSGIQWYMGRGMLVARNGVTINGQLAPAAFATAAGQEIYDGTPMPILTTNDCLGISSLGDIVQTGDGWVAGAMFCAGKYTNTSTSSKFRGSIISEGIDFQKPNQWLVTQTGLAQFLPAGMPPLNNLNARGDWFRN